jgi:hypothetical protein
MSTDDEVVLEVEIPLPLNWVRIHVSYDRKTVDDFMRRTEWIPDVGFKLLYVQITGGDLVGVVPVIELVGAFNQLGPWERANVLYEMQKRMERIMADDFAKLSTAARRSEGLAGF